MTPFAVAGFVLFAGVVLAVRMLGFAWLRRAVRQGAVDPSRGWYVFTAVHTLTAVVAVAVLVLVSGSDAATAALGVLIVAVTYGGASFLLSESGIAFLSDLAPGSPGRAGRALSDHEHPRRRPPNR